jgi:hypothetical protein
MFSVTFITGFSFKVETYSALADMWLLTKFPPCIKCLLVCIPVHIGWKRVLALHILKLKL